MAARHWNWQKAKGKNPIDLATGEELIAVL